MTFVKLQFNVDTSTNVKGMNGHSALLFARTV